MPEPVFIFDLDETILSVNSYHYWVRYLLAGRFQGLKTSERLLLSLATLQTLLVRKILKRSHIQTKQRLQRLWALHLEKDAGSFALKSLLSKLELTVRPEILPLLEKVRHGEIIGLLATAAASEYALPLAEKLGFSHALATLAFKNNSATENSRRQKRDSVLKYLQRQSWQDAPRIFFTDHEEDLPMILISQTVVWFGTDEEMAKLKNRVPNINFLSGLSATTYDYLDQFAHRAS